ncbi:hypothetical protein M405DRAFT_846360 [Rhizopogon salebrosus TDB-379]|nr:hypothetical protein M405DRAFT_846360 [Rhizopogon salebrosus TDB-379]
MQEMQEAEDQLAEQRRKRKEEKERECKAQEEKEKHECKAQEEKEKHERQERERLEKQRMEQECREDQERVCTLEETRKTDAARQKAKDAEVHKYLEDLESEALMKGKIFYRVQKISHKSAGKPSGATTQARGTLPGVPGERVTLINSKGQSLTGMRNESRCGQCELGNRACVAPDNATYAVKQTLARCIHCAWGHKKCEFPDDSEQASMEVVEPGETLGVRETRKHAASNTLPRGGKGKKKAREEHGTIEVDDTAWVTMANNLVIVGGDTLRFLHEWEDRAQEWRNEDRVECEMYRAQAARAESSLQASVRELRKLESSARAERRAAERAHSEAHAELIGIQHEMLDMLKELRDQNKDADGNTSDIRSALRTPSFDVHNKDWKKVQEKPSTQLKQLHPLCFVVDKRNRPIPLEQVGAIRATSHRVFVDIWNLSEKAKSWGTTSGLANKMYYHEMITFFPELGYCDNNWKCDAIAMMSYTSWQRNHLNRLIHEGKYKPTAQEMVEFGNLEMLDSDDINGSTGEEPTKPKPKKWTSVSDSHIASTSRKKQKHSAETFG